jgi:hypothetical protein
MGRCEVTISGREFDGADDDVGSLEGKLQEATNNEALNTFGDDYLRDPTDIAILPVKLFGETKFLIRAHHSTESSEGQVAIFQPHDFSFELTVESGKVFLRTETNRAYPLTFDEQFMLKRLARIARLISIDYIKTN